MTQRGESLRVMRNGEIVFSSRGKWLHPLLELEGFLRASRLEPSSLAVWDKIVGRAAALLMVRLGIREVYAALLSSLGEAALRAYGVNYRYDRMIPRIACRTEELLANVQDPEEAYRIILERISARSSDS